MSRKPILHPVYILVCITIQKSDHSKNVYQISKIKYTACFIESEMLRTPGIRL
jgi:hypothetical protein